MDWSEVIGDATAPNEFVLTIGETTPWWFHNALIRKEITPRPRPNIGDLSWGLNGVVIEATGAMFPVGATIRKSDIPV